MLIGLAIRDIVLIESLDLSFGPGLTALTGETGAGKSIILGALGLALGGRADTGLVRRGAAQGVASAIFAPGRDHPVWAWLDEKGLGHARDEDLVLRRTLAADGRSRAFVNDQPTGAAVLREAGAMLVEIHGQHETVGLLDARTHRPLLDAYGGLEPETAATSRTWTRWRAAAERLAALEARRAEAGAEAAELAEKLAELDRLAPREGEEDALATERAVVGAAEKALTEIAAAADHLGGETAGARLGQALRALERAGERLSRAGADAASGPRPLIAAAAAAVERALAEAAEAAAAIDAAAGSLDFEPGRLDRCEERLFALRAAGRRMGVPVDGLAALRVGMAERLLALEGAGEALDAARGDEAAARQGWVRAASVLTAARRAAGGRLAAGVAAELAPLKLDKARFRVDLETVAVDRAGPGGADRVEFQVATLPGAPFAALGSIASGGELARLALALKAQLVSGGGGGQPLMIFDEVDQGVGGAVADAVGVRLQRLAKAAQVIVVTHSPQVAARADAHWRVDRSGGEIVRARVEALDGPAREEEIARMLSGAKVTDAARAAARALMHA